MTAPLPLLPIPASGLKRISRLSGKELLVECAQFNKADNDRLVGFFNQMYGRVGAFRFEHGATSFPRCHFGSDQLDMEQTGPGMYRTSFTVEVFSKH